MLEPEPLPAPSLEPVLELEPPLPCEPELESPPELELLPDVSAPALLDPLDSLLDVAELLSLLPVSVPWSVPV